MNNTTEELGTAKEGKLLFKLALPAITAQIINLLYNLVDRMYIGHIKDIGKMALTGVGVCLPLIMLITAFAALVSMGGAPRASIYLGKGEKDNAEKTLGNCITMLIFISIILTFIFILFSEKMLLMFGASENTIRYAIDYMKIYSLGTIFVQLTMGLTAFVTAEGFSKISMFTIIIGAIANIILDPVLIFGFGMGVKGAALATIISQFISAVFVLKFILSEKTVIKLKISHMRLEKKIIIPALALGLSPFVMQATESIIAVCFNSSLLKYGGDIAVASMTILTSVMSFSLLPLNGLTQGAQPIISYNYGARNPGRVKKTFKLLLISCLSYSLAIWALSMIIPQIFMKIFTNDAELIEYGKSTLRMYMAMCGIFGIQIACQQTFVSLGNATYSLFLALLRKVFLLIPLIYIMPAIFTGNKPYAIFCAEPVADTIAVATTSIVFYFQFNKAMKKLS